MKIWKKTAFEVYIDLNLSNLIQFLKNDKKIFRTPQAEMKRHTMTCPRQKNHCMLLNQWKRLRDFDIMRNIHIKNEIYCSYFQC